MHIFKFGGASVKDADAVRNLKMIVQQIQSEQLVIVISAMGQGTNHLESLVQKGINSGDYQSDLQNFKSFNASIATELLGQACQACEILEQDLEDELEAIAGEDWVNAYDRVVPFGELISTRIIAEFLKKDLPVKWMDARRFVKTDGFHTEANIVWEQTKQKVNAELRPVLENTIVVTQGFIGSTESDITTTLGREGSDFTGAILAHCLDAENLTVWKDVPGILNADPKLKPEAEQFLQLSYREVTEMTYYGAKVIHPKTLKPLAQKNIPLIVRSFLQHESPGTYIGIEKSIKELPVFIFKENQLLFSLEVKDHNFMDEKRLSIILTALDKLNVKINLMQNSAATFSFCMDNKTHKLDPILEALSSDFEVTYNRPLKLITVKNYTEEALAKLPPIDEILLLQKTRNTYQVLHR
ncbi:MAG: aspartate kinase [Cytophagales bacterium]|nr:aspartate kinase [Cytophagales bacterium]